MMADERQTLYKVGDEVVFTLNGIPPNPPLKRHNMLYKHVPYDMVSKK